ncbi:hypothetical protein CTI12_AA276140 [Artemisia annua]|uniref:Transmembrane protein n=1 Tax=Artemisia annua TaxID=35608 RepID=A0A2U1NEK7_ARTAN|nr:hypothetical protein CTI12_AA276140 [Artemisia annua]
MANVDQVWLLSWLLRRRKRLGIDVSESDEEFVDVDSWVIPAKLFILVLVSVLLIPPRFRVLGDDRWVFLLMDPCVGDGFVDESVGFMVIPARFMVIPTVFYGSGC